MGSGLLACLIVNPLPTHPSTQNKVSKEAYRAIQSLASLLGDREHRNIPIFSTVSVFLFVFFFSIFLGYFLEYVSSFPMGFLFGQQYSQFLNTYSLYSELPFYGILFT